MGNVEKMHPKGALKGKAFIQDFLERYGDEIGPIVIVAMNDKEEVIDGWSDECHQKIVATLGLIEQVKLDFWNTVFFKREDLL